VAEKGFGEEHKWTNLVFVGCAFNPSPLKASVKTY
jgi:hypothetical protein